jgi:Kef-type K+ transport system membrane component KefB/Trk K+ transport system NAD-binding subunit/mannitol/fructose-specific phosphotransferase system IIA component (Ntr-type)
MEFSILNLLFVLLAAWLAGMLATRLGYPSVLGELLAGIVLGPPLLGLLHGSEALAVLAEVGIILMMLYIGMEIDPKELTKASKGGLLAALGGFITPFVLCYLLVVWMGGSAMAAIFVGVAAGVTSLATKSRILVDLKLLDTRIAHVMMAGALVADTLSLIIFAGIIGVAEAGTLSMSDLVIVALKAVVFFALSAFAGLKLLPALMRKVQVDGLLGRTGTFTLLLLITLIFAEGAELAGLHGILGAFLAGLFLRESALGHVQTKELMHLVRDASLGFLAPVFFVTAGFAVSLDVFTTDLGLLVGVVGLATVGKIVGTALFYLPTGFGWREGVTIGAGMNGRGAVEIIVAQIGLSIGLITQEVFSILVFMAIATTATVPLFLKWGVDWLRDRGELVRSTADREGALIIGAGPTARALAAVLGRTQPVVLVDRNVEHCDRAEDEGLTVVRGNALDEDLLAEAGAATVRYAITMTGNIEVDALVAQRLHMVFLTPEVLVLDPGSEEGHRTLRDHLNASSLFAGATDLPDWDYRIDHQRVEHTEMDLERELTPEELFAELQQQRNNLPLALRRGEQYLPFHGDSTLEEGDRIIALQVLEVPTVSFDRFDQLVAEAPILDIKHAEKADAFFDLVAAELAPRVDIEAGRLASAFRLREASSSTVLLPGLAIPHITIPGDGRFEVLLARCREGIRFPGQEETVNAAFVLVSTSDERTFHLRALSAIAKIVQWPDFEQKWLTASDAEALRRLVLGASRRRIPEAEDTLAVN